MSSGADFHWYRYKHNKYKRESGLQQNFAPSSSQTTNEQRRFFMSSNTAWVLISVQDSFHIFHCVKPSKPFKAKMPARIAVDFVLKRLLKSSPCLISESDPESKN